MLVPFANEQALTVLGWNRAKSAGLIPEGAEIKTVVFTDDELNTYKADIDWADTVIINSEISSVSKIKSNSYLYTAPQRFVDYAESKDKVTIVMSVDKPYDVQLYSNADAVLAVYGCQGSTIDPTEALLGGVTEGKDAFGPNIVAGVEVIFNVSEVKGKLPINIPVLDMESFTYTNEIKYPRGFGLSYENSTDDSDTDTNSDTDKSSDTAVDTDTASHSDTDVSSKTSDSDKTSSKENTSSKDNKNSSASTSSTKSAVSSTNSTKTSVSSNTAVSSKTMDGSTIGTGIINNFSILFVALVITSACVLIFSKKRNKDSDN